MFFFQPFNDCTAPAIQCDYSLPGLLLQFLGINILKLITYIEEIYF